MWHRLYFSFSQRKKLNLDLLGPFKITLNFGKHIVNPHLAPNIWNHLAPSYCPPIVYSFNPSFVMSLPGAPTSAIFRATPGWDCVERCYRVCISSVDEPENVGVHSNSYFTMARWKIHKTLENCITWSWSLSGIQLSGYSSTCTLPSTICVSHSLNARGTHR